MQFAKIETLLAFLGLDTFQEMPADASEKK